MLIYSCVLPIVTALICGGLLLSIAKKKRSIYLWEYLDLITPFLIWNLLTIKLIGSQSISNVVEVYFLLIIILVNCFMKYRGYFLNLKNKLLITVSLNLLAVLLRLFMPVLGE